MKQKSLLSSLLLLALCCVLPPSAWGADAQVVMQQQFGRQDIVVPADGELVFYDFKGLDDISSTSSNNQHSLTVFTPETAGMSVQVTFESIDIRNDGSSYPGKVLIYNGDPDPEKSFQWATTTSGVTGSTTMPEGDVLASLDGEFSNLTYYSTASDGSLGVGVLWRYAKRCSGWVAKVKCVQLTNMQVTGAGASYTNISAAPKSKSNVPMAGLYVTAEGVMNADNLTWVDFSLPENEGVIDPLAVKIFAGDGSDIKNATALEATVAASGNGYRLSLDKALESGTNNFVLAADILGDASVGAKVKVDINGVGSTAFPDGISPFTSAEAVEIVNPAIVVMVPGSQTVTVGTTPLAFYDDGGIDGDATSKFSGTTTFVPGLDGSKVQIDFSRIKLANGSIYYQYLNVYNGREATAENLITRVYNDTPILIHSTAADGSLTVEMADNGTSQTGEGFEAAVSLFTPQAMELQQITVAAASEETFRAGATAQAMALINLRTANTEPALKLSALTLNSTGAQGLVANAYLATAATTPTVVATATENNGIITFNLAEPLELAEYDNNLMVLIDLSAQAQNEQTVTLGVASATLNGTVHQGPAETVSRSVLNKIIADAGTQDVTITGTWIVENKPSDYSYYGYDNINGDQIIIIRPGVEGAVAQLNFSKLSIYFSSYSYYGSPSVFKIINGAGTSGTVLFEATKDNQTAMIGQDIRSTDASGALTILFNTNGNRGTSTSNGFSAAATTYKVQPMVLQQAAVAQASTADIYPSDIEEEILRLKITTEGSLNPLSLDRIVVDLKGSQDMVQTVKLISSGSNAEYVQPVVVMASAPAAESVTLTPSEETRILPEKDSYYWIAFDMKDRVVSEAQVDAAVTSLVVNGNAVAVETPDPEGARTARNIYKFHGDDVVTVDESLLFYDNGGPNSSYNRDHSGSVVFKPSDPSKIIRLHFNSFKTGYNDKFYVYNGSEAIAANQLIELFGDKAKPRDLSSSAADGALTATFRTGSYGLMDEGWEIVVECVDPQPFAVSAINIVSPVATQVYSGSENNLMLHLALDITGDRSEYSLSQLNFDLADTQLSALASAKMWSTGIEANFIGAEPFGEAITPAEGTTALTFNGDYPFTGAGTYHFWLSYDIAPDQTAGSVLKATLRNLTVGGEEVAAPQENPTASTSVREGMHGDYIIGTSAAADYKTFVAAIRDLVNNGVDGPVNMLIEDGTYDEAFTLQPVPGASSANRITFRSQSNDRDKVTIAKGEANKELSNPIITFADGASYLTLQAITVSSPANKSEGLIYLNGGCYHNTIDNCVVRGYAGSAYSERVVLIYTYYLEENDKNCNWFTLSNSLLEGGYYGLSLTGITNLNYPMMIHDATVEGNTFVNQSSKALQAMGVDGNLRIVGNVFTNNGQKMASGYHNMDLYRCTGEVVVAGNLIDVYADRMSSYNSTTTSSSADGIYIRDITASRASHKYIYNNDISIVGATGTSHTLYGIYVNDNDPALPQSMDIAHNTVVISGTASANSSTFITGAPLEGSSIRNNILQNEAGGPLLRTTSKGDLSKPAIAGNALHTSGNVWVMTSSDLTSLDEAASTLGQPLGIAEQASFLSAEIRELAAAGNLVGAQPVDFVRDDLLGNPRNQQTPTIGAYEYAPQTGVPAWNEGYPNVDLITLTGANLNLSADKASRARYLVLAADAQAPSDADFDNAPEVALHTSKAASAKIADLEQNTAYSAYVRLVSYLGEAAPEIARVDFRTLSPEPVYTNPTATITTSITSGNEGDRIRLVGFGEGGKEPLTFRWTDQAGNVLSQEQTAATVLSHSMTYRFTVTDDRGKEATAEINIEVSGNHYIATFEDLALEPESYWPGNQDNVPFYSGSYAFDSYKGDYEGTDFWGKYRYSNRSSSAYNSMSDQYNCAAGSGVDGSATFGVGYLDPYMGSSYITVTNDAEGMVVPGMWLTNSAWVMDCILNGDGLSTEPGGFTDGDYFKVTIAGLRNGTNIGSLDFYLADYRQADSRDHYALNTWEWVDLSSLGTVNKLWLTIESTKRNDWGITTPLYLCVDNVGDACPVAEAPQQTVRILDQTDAALDLGSLFSFNPSEASVNYQVLEAPEGAGSLSSEEPGTFIIPGTITGYETEPFVLTAKATQKGRSEYKRIPVLLSYATGLESVEVEAVEVYPIPAHDYINVATTLSDYTVEIFDISGKSILSREGLSGDTRLWLPAVAGGTYLLRVRCAQGSTVRRIIIR